MFIQYRPTTEELAATAQMWANNFRASRQYDWRTAMTLRRDFRWKLIRSHITAQPVLDAGCGYGEWVVFLSRNNYECEGLDYSQELITRLCATYPELRWCAADIREMPYADDSFGGVFSWGVVEHDPEGPNAALAEFFRVLRPGGRVIVTVPIDSERRRRSSQLQFPSSKGARFFQYFMTIDEISAYVIGAGFRLIEAGHILSNSAALLAPTWYARARGRGFVVKSIELVGRALPQLPSLSSMAYCVAEKPL